ncbi:MAG: hypothetical protein OXG49_16035 [Chloroflexi bacterium]|nr:hypothetical protein [Chloroflexota bacterium]
MLYSRTSQDNREGSSATSTRGSDGEQRGVLLASLLMIVIGWGGLLYLVISTRPRIGGEIWLFFILLQIAVTGTSIPFMRLVSQRLRPVNDRVPLAGVVVRRSVWIGIIVVTCAWLMIPRYMSLPILLILMLLIAVIEVFLRNRELANER